MKDITEANRDEEDPRETTAGDARENVCATRGGQQDLDTAQPPPWEDIDMNSATSLTNSVAERLAQFVSIDLTSEPMWLQRISGASHIGLDISVMARARRTQTAPHVYITCEELCGTHLLEEYKAEEPNAHAWAIMTHMTDICNHIV